MGKAIPQLKFSDLTDAIKCAKSLSSVSANPVFISKSVCKGFTTWRVCEKKETAKNERIFYCWLNGEERSSDFITRLLAQK